MRYNKRRKEEHISSKEESMIDPITSTPQVNFLTDNLPPNTDNFYNSKQFAQNEVQFLSTMISIDQKAQQNGLQQIKDAINGLT